MKISSIDLLIIFSYLLFISFMGFWFGRREKNIGDYFLGSKRMPWLAVSLSIMATEASALTFIGAPAFSYNNNFSYLQLAIGSFLGRILSAHLLIGAFYKAKVTTVYEYLAIRFGPRTRDAGALLFLITRLLASGVRLYAASIALSIVTGLPDLWAISLVAAVAIIYTIAGGIKAVIWTDVFQFFIFMGGASLALVFIILKIPGGWETVVKTASEYNKFKIFDFSLSFTNAYTLLAGIIGGCFLTFATHGTDQDIVQRMLTCKQSRGGKMALILTGIINFPIVILFLTIGISLFTFHKLNPTIYLPAKADYIFPSFIIHELPSGIAGLALVGVFAAAMSSLDSALNALGSSAVIDFYRPYIRPIATDKHYLKVSRILSFAAGLLLIIVALFSRKAGSVLILGLQ
ncbi:MAG: sodium:solute symporter, partial [Candidatus Theseobacter exili]|nr:sodium:solute symporter [Candidatus Theseobacter exili]